MIHHLKCWCLWCLPCCWWFNHQTSLEIPDEIPICWWFKHHFPSHPNSPWFEAVSFDLPKLANEPCWGPPEPAGDLVTSRKAKKPTSRKGFFVGFIGGYWDSLVCLFFWVYWDLLGFYLDLLGFIGICWGLFGFIGIWEVPYSWGYPIAELDGLFRGKSHL